MKKLLILLFFVPFFLLAQNPLDQRTAKNPTRNAIKNAALEIDGRQSTQPSFMTPLVCQDLAQNTPQTLTYQVKYESTYGLPNYLAIHAPRQQKSGFGVKNENEEIALEKVLSDLPSLFLWKENTQLVETQKSTDDLGIIHNRYQQTIQGVQVRGGEWIIHHKNNEVVSANGRIYPSATVDVAQLMHQATAENVAYAHITTKYTAYQPASLGVIDRTTRSELCIDFEVNADELQPHVVYVVEVRPTDLHYYHVWVDAHTGKVLKTVDALCEVDGPKTATATHLNNQSVTLKTYQVGSTFYLIDATKSMWTTSQPSSFPDNPVGAIWTIDAGNTPAQDFSHVSSSNNTWSERSSVSAHYNAGLAFDYFKNTHNRNSLNGSGGSIISVVNVADEDGSSLANAYWNGQAMFYGNGGNVFKPLAGALDVAGHELTHGVVSNSANLEYQGQSGAINESMADVFGAMIDRDDWKMGEDFVKAGVFAGGALRNLQDPHNGTTNGNNGYQPAKMSEYYTGTQDNGGVHINSGIVNKAFYLAATASGMSKNKAEKIWYRALTVYLTKRSQFLDLRYACVDAANDLYSTAESNAVKAAFDQVQIYDPNGGNGGGSDDENELPTNSGAEFIISVDVDIFNSTTLYKSTPTPDNYVGLTQNTPKRKCSVTDDGKYLYYVTELDALKRIELKSPYTEVLMSNFDWDNVAVSKDGKLLAGVSTDIDGAIWVMQISEGVWTKFNLYNPTYSQGVSAGNVNYADAIEFDHTGQYILYDAQNELTNASGTNITWWDLGVIRVWNKDQNDWGDGKVEKVFSQLPEDISIGNASYSKNSPNIITYDHIDVSTDIYSVRATNMVTNSTGNIFSQSNKLGYPNYSNQDDKIIFDALDGNGDEVIGVATLTADKLSIDQSTQAAVLIPDAKWGVWYAEGTRNLLSDKKELLSFSFPSLEGSPVGVFSGKTISIKVPSGTDLNVLTPSFTHSNDATVTVGSVKQISGVTANNFSNAVTYVVTAQDGTTANYTVRVTTFASVSELQKSIHVYPNPTNQWVHIQTDLHLENIRVLNIHGTQQSVTLENGAIDLATLAQGIYFITFDTPAGTVVKRINKL